MYTALAAPHTTRRQRVLGVLRSNGMDDAVRVKLEIAASQFPSFLERTQTDRAALRPGTRSMLGPDKDFWDPMMESAPDGLRSTLLEGAPASA